MPEIEIVSLNAFEAMDRRMGLGRGEEVETEFARRTGLVDNKRNRLNPFDCSL